MGFASQIYNYVIYLAIDGFIHIYFFAGIWL